MASVLGALAPIFLLILLGWLLRARAVLPDTFWPPAETLTYYVFFPALLVANLAEAKLGGLPMGGLMGAQAGGILTVAALGAALRTRAAMDGAAFSSLYQASFRPNTYVGLAAAAGLWGPPGVTLTAICVALVVPLVNLLCVVALVRWNGTGTPRWRDTALPVLKNPLIWACLAGIALNVTGIGLPPVAGPFLKILAGASLPLGLLAVGAGLDLRDLRGAEKAVAAAVAVKLAVLPVLTGALAWTLGVGGLPLVVAVAYSGLPIAPNSYMLARQLGGDAKLMAGLITVSTLAAAVTLPVLVTLVEGLR